MTTQEEILKMEKVKEIKLVLASGLFVWDNCGVIVDGKVLPVTSLNVEISPEGQEFLHLRIHLRRVEIEGVKGIVPLKPINDCPKCGCDLLDQTQYETKDSA